MVRHVLSIGLIFSSLILVILNKAECKSGGGHYSSQRSLGSGPSAGYGFSGSGHQQNSMNWGNPWFSSDLNSWYDYDNMVIPLILFLLLINSSEFFCQLIFTSLTMPNKDSHSSSSSSSSQQHSQSMPNYYYHPYYHLALNDSDSIPDEQRLMAQLLRNYDPSARPVYNASNTVSVAFGIALTQLSDMDEKNQVLTTNIWLEQEWFDERLVWNASDFNGLTTLRLPCSKIWLPDIVLYNSADDYTQGYYQSKAMVENNGHVFWPPPAKFRSSCKIDVTFFPFDDQLCKLKFGSWIYDAAQVNLTKRRDNVDMTNYIRSGEWHIVHIAVKRNDVTYPCCPGIYYPDVTIYVHIRRRVLYYLFNIILPCIWLSILSLLGFCLPPDSGEKITLGITVLLAFSVFMLLIAESMPATSEMVPLIEIYLTIVMALTSLSIILTVYVLQLHHSGPVVIPVPHSFKYSLVRRIAPVIGMKKIVEIYAREHNLTEKDYVYRCFAQASTQPTNTSAMNHKSRIINEKKKTKHRQEANHRNDPHYDGEERYNHNDKYDNDEERITKELLISLSTRNGDIRSASLPSKRRHHHHSRSRRIPQVVLIPQQHYPESTLKSSSNLTNSRSPPNLFNSNMHLLETHLKHLINKQKREEDRNETINEWKLMALIMDRLLFWLFAIFTVLSTILCLIIIPFLKNAGYIPVLSTDLVTEYKATATVANVTEGQLRINLSDVSTVDT
ncbi:unnamed protein product [Rotaria socialis]|uniref:Uncharacterized protein n=1 Tax=Rotaria socialis TaxID=392032 RepID=A0A820DKG4_9BILA|nr:unnamed protein product [Rotaria socialis]CAF3326596.1 unnamed protein product [Rotaria socialis]CAF3518743.1 unnamed protein product [Rotaria socialis]CAF4119104.1 unnamed protein product [Rotaria socialis]CAF4218149.1 unnamed protein product [Rotaria socialis]